MRLSVVAASLILLFSQSTIAQHSSGGGGSSGGGASSGGSSSGSSGGGSHGGGGSSGGFSGGHVSGGGSGSHGSGSSGALHVSTSSQAAPGFVHGPGKIDTLHETGERALYSSVTGESSEVHNQLLDQALAKLQYALPANFKNEEPFSAKSLKAIEPASGQKAGTKPQAKKEEPEGRPCHGHNCHPRRVTEYRTIGTNWRISRDLYTTVQGDCRHIAAKLAQEESKVAALQTGQSSKCAMNPVDPACASATKAMNKLNAKISRLHDRYDQCVLQDLRHNAAISVSRK